MKIQYVLVPGYVISRSDGDEHYISASMLQQLYKVNPAQCITAPPLDNTTQWEPPEGAVLLFPRQDGNYTKPKENDE